MSTLSIAAYFPLRRVKVSAQSVAPEADVAFIDIQPDLRFAPLCQECGSPAPRIHSRHVRAVRDLDFASAHVWLRYSYRKLFCPACQGVVVEELELVERWQRVTRRLARLIHELCKVMTVSDVARHFGLNWKSVKNIDKNFLEDQYGQSAYEGLRILAVDEISLSHGQNGYMTVVLDYLTGRVVWMGEGRKAETLDAFFDGMTDKQKQGIEAVAMDMWEAFVKSVKKNCPRAKIVFDLFHLVKGYGEVIDAVRRQEYKNADKDKRSFIKGSRYLLLSNRENLLSDQQARLDELLAVNGRLSAVYILKDQLKAIHRYRHRGWAKRTLDQWCELAEQVDHPLMRRFIGRLRFFEYGILNHCDYPIGTSPLEGVNNKIKVIKRKAYGFHDTRYFALKVKQALPGVKLTTETG